MIMIFSDSIVIMNEHIYTFSNLNIIITLHKIVMDYLLTDIGPKGEKRYSCLRFQLKKHTILNIITCTNRRKMLCSS